MTKAPRLAALASPSPLVFVGRDPWLSSALAPCAGAIFSGITTESWGAGGSRGDEGGGKRKGGRMMGGGRGARDGSGREGGTWVGGRRRGMGGGSKGGGGGAAEQCHFGKM